MNVSEQIERNIDKSKYEIAINLRLLGFTYRKISENPEVNVKEHTIRTWFMKGGKCYNDYKVRLEDRLDEYKELFENFSLQLKDISIDAINTIRQAVRNGNVTASFKVLNLVLIQNYIKYENPADEGIDLLREVVEKIRENVIEEKNNKLQNPS